jgi:hypothetical protein
MQGERLRSNEELRVQKEERRGGLMRSSRAEDEWGLNACGIAGGRTGLLDHCNRK